jgi:hypothetical protein
MFIPGAIWQECNIKNIATALEMYGIDNELDYPPSLEYLVKDTGI